MSVPRQTPLASLLLPLLLAPSATGQAGAAQDAAGARSVERVFYDWYEDGVLRGGVLLADPDDPLLTDTGPVAARSHSAWTTLSANGPSANRIDLVLVGDGYTAGELGAYAGEVDLVLAAFFAEPPLDRYSSYFNVHRVDVVSAESGVDHDPVQGILRSTALDMGYWCGGVQRALCVNVSKAKAEAASAPDADQILALANSSTYGGSGYPSQDLGTLAGGNSAAIEVALHEFGHSFADLADEYDYGGPTTWPGGEPSAANVSIFDAGTMAAQQRKWHLWLPEANVGTFQGANYSVLGIYRPTNDSLMRNLYRPLEQVNAEQFVLSLYRTVRPIDDATPAGVYGPGHVFFVDPLDPVAHVLDVQWSVDGAAVPGATGTTFSALGLGLPPGPHVVSVEVVDRTPLVRDEALRMQLLRQVRSWTIEDTALVVPYGCGSNPAGSLVHRSGVPRPGATLVFEVDNPIGTNAPGSWPVLLLSLAPDPAFPCGTPLPGPTFSMNPLHSAELLVDLAPGVLVQPFLIGPPHGGYLTPPVQVSVPVPNDASLIGTSVYLQGVLFDPTGSFGVRFPLTTAYQLLVGP